MHKIWTIIQSAWLQDNAGKLKYDQENQKENKYFALYFITNTYSSLNSLQFDAHQLHVVCETQCTFNVHVACDLKQILWDVILCD